MIGDLADFTWGEPLFIETSGETFLAPRQPVRIGDALKGVVTAVVSTGELSEFLQRATKPLGGVSFVLYGRDRVFAHPALAGDRPDAPELSTDHPLPTIAEVDDPVLAAVALNLAANQPFDRIDEILAGTGIQGILVEAGGADHVLLSREFTKYGATPWLVGVHFQIGRAHV